MTTKDKVRIIFNHSKIDTPSGETILVTVVTFEDPSCSDVNFVVGMRDYVADKHDNKGAIYVFPMETDNKLRFGIVYEGHIGDEIASVLSVERDSQIINEYELNTTEEIQTSVTTATESKEG